jgi:hypothetical protein
LFATLVDSHSWSTVKLDRCGLQFFYVHVLERDWDWLRIVKPLQVRRLPDTFSVEELARLLRSVHRLRSIANLDAQRLQGGQELVSRNARLLENTGKSADLELAVIGDNTPCRTLAHYDVTPLLSGHHKPEALKSGDRSST